MIVAISAAFELRINIYIHIYMHDHDHIGEVDLGLT